MNLTTPIAEPAPEKKALTLPDNITTGQLIALYVKMRDRIKATELKQKEELAPAKEMLATMGTRLLDLLNQAEGNSIQANAGTAYRTARVSASIADGQSFRDFVIANDMHDLLDWKANAPAVQDYITEYGEAPPGVNLNVAYTVGVRRSSD